jgi:hypothetical protein
MTQKLWLVVGISASAFGTCLPGMTSRKFSVPERNLSEKGVPMNQHQPSTPQEQRTRAVIEHFN